MVGSESLNQPPAEAAPPPNKYGVTKPLSLAGPTDADLQRNAALEKFLKESELYESEEETARREEVLHQLDQVQALTVSGLSSQNPGVQMASPAAFATERTMPDKVSKKLFQINDQDFKKIRTSLGG